MSLSSNWYDALKMLVKAVAEGKSGQVGRLEVKPPDARLDVTLIAMPGVIRVGSFGHSPEYPPDKSDVAVDVYVSAVEGSA